MTGFSALAALALVLLVHFTPGQTASGSEWTYDGEKGPEKWSRIGYQQCQGERQSPINVVTSRVIRKHFKPIEFHHFDQIPMQMNFSNNYHSARSLMRWEDMPFIKGGGLPGTFDVFNFHFHWGNNDFKGSEHTVDGESYPLEMHIVCKNIKYPAITEALQHPDGLAVLGVMFEVSGGNNRALKSLETPLRQVTEGGSEVQVEDPPRLLELMPWNTNDFYRYDGSLTTPNCNEVVTWTIFLETVKITEKQLELFRSLKKSPERIGKNYRPPQNRYGRSVFLSKPEAEGEELVAGGLAARLRNGAVTQVITPLVSVVTLLASLLLGR